MVCSGKWVRGFMKYTILILALALSACQTGKPVKAEAASPNRSTLQGSPNTAQVVGMSLYDLGHAMSDGRVDIYDPSLPAEVVVAPVVYTQALPTAPVDTIEVAPVGPAPEMMTFEQNEVVLPPSTDRFIDDPSRRNNPDGSDYRQRPLMTY